MLGQSYNSYVCSMQQNMQTIKRLGLHHVDMMQAETPYFVRRKSKVLPPELQTAGEKAHQVDWKRSVLLNLVTQTTYSLTVSACTREHLQSVGSSQASSTGSVQVIKRLSHTLNLLTLLDSLCSQQADVKPLDLLLVQAMAVLHGVSASLICFYLHEQSC